MENSRTDIESLMAGFFAGSPGEVDLERLNRWLNEDVAHRRELNRLRSVWIMAGYETGKKGFDARAGWSSVEPDIKPVETGWIRRFAPLWRAASLLICFASGLAVSAVVLWHKPAQQQDLATSTTVSVPLGAKGSVLLPDNSSVWLNAGSSITYPADFGLEKRDLQLTGEAFFDVKSDSLKPFNVHTSGITVQARGTRFNVKAYPDDSTIAATLEEGTVHVEIPVSLDGKQVLQSVKLKPKEQLVIQKKAKPREAAAATSGVREPAAQAVSVASVAGEVTVKPNVQTELSTSWKDNKWIISNEPLALFASNLERRYNLHIRFVSDELKDYHFSGTFENETVDQILTALSLAAPVYYKFNKNNIELSLNQTDRDKFSKILKTKNN